MFTPAKKLSNEILQDDWITVLGSKTKKEAKVSYSMLEEVTPPPYMWERISYQLDIHQNMQTPHTHSLSRNGIIAMLITGAILSITLILYCVI